MGKRSIIQWLLKEIDTAGAPPMTQEDWRDLLLDLIMECESRLEAVNEDLRNRT